MKHARRSIGYLLAVLGGMLVVDQHAEAQSGISFSATELLGRPTDSSATLNLISNQAIEAYVEYGTTSGSPSQSTTPLRYDDGYLELTVGGLSADTQYYYRVRYRPAGSTETYQTGQERRFHTQRAVDAPFTFTITSDSHQGFSAFHSPSLYSVALANVLADAPDFHFDLGDTFSLDGNTETAATVAQKYLNQRSALGLTMHSAPLFLVLGNHENEEGWNLDDKGPSNVAQSVPVLGANARKQYFVNPVPDGFYTGNLDDSIPEIAGDRLKEDYYAFEWGNTLFVALDPFWYTMTKPYSGTLGGEQNDEVVGDRWDWTLGEEQYEWLRATLSTSTAKFKLVFIHHLAGGSIDYSRGGAEAAAFCEWGGYNPDLSWGFDVERPGWDKPVHDVLVENGVDILFHGHDHTFALDEADGVVYQLIPHPAHPDAQQDYLGFPTNQDDYSQAYANLGQCPTASAGPCMVANSGHLRVNVAADSLSVDYVRAFPQGYTGPGGETNGHVAYSYTIEAEHPNHPPVAVADVGYTVSEDSALSLAVLGNDSDEDNDALNLIGVSQPLHGSVSIENQQLLYVPNPDYCNEQEPDSFGYEISDGTASATAAVAVWVSCVEDFPVALDDSFSVIAGASTSLAVLLNDTDADADLLLESLAIFEAPIGGSLSLGPNGTLDYLPLQGFRGDDSFQYEVCDLAGNCVLGSVALVVYGPSDQAFEFVTREVSGLSTTVLLSSTYFEPVVVCSSGYSNNTSPVIVRVSNVASNEFEVRLLNPSGAPVAPELVSCMVVELGTWTIDGLKFEAQKYVSRVTDHTASWVGEVQTYGHEYVSPVVLGQVMSENDPDWSVFWSRGTALAEPPSPSQLVTGKTVAEDPDRSRAHETVGFIVIESGHGVVSGLEYEAGVGPASIRGVDDNPPFAYAFGSSFAHVPEGAVVTLAGVNGRNGGWAQTHGASPLTQSSLALSIDEDQLSDSERGHGAEQVAYVAFAPVPPPVAGVLEFGSAQVGSVASLVQLDHTYQSPVVVCSVRYANNTVPVVPRVSEVGATSFKVRLQNPSGASVQSDLVSYVVVEAGAWQIDGVKLEAQAYTSTLTDSKSSWVGEARTYLQSYKKPVVMGQVMTEHDSAWSAFWARGATSQAPPSASTLFTGHMVGEDPDRTRAPERIGFIVVEAGHGFLGDVEYEARVGAATIEGIDDSPPFSYAFSSPFSDIPGGVLTTLAGMKGNNGGWAQAYGAEPLTLLGCALSVDEDQTLDSERGHGAEQVAYLAFGSD